MSENRTGCAASLVVKALVVFVEAAILEHCDPLAQSVLELQHPRLQLVEPLGLFHALDVGSKRFGQIDCGEHLHDRTHNGPTILVDLSVPVSDIRHFGSPGADAQSDGMAQTAAESAAEEPEDGEQCLPASGARRISRGEPKFRFLREPVQFHSRGN